MNKLTGKGGVIQVDGKTIAHVTSFSWSEGKGEIYGQNRSEVNLTSILTKGSDIFRRGKIVSLLLNVGNSAIKIRVNRAKVDTCSVPVEQGSAIKQTVKFISQLSSHVA